MFSKKFFLILSFPTLFFAQKKMLSADFDGDSIKDKVYLERFYGAMAIFIKKYYRKQKPFQYLLMKTGLKMKYELEKGKI